jgi:hypothetical protein
MQMIFLGTFAIFPQLKSIIMCMFSLILIFSLWTSEQLSTNFGYFTDIQFAAYSFIQILTLDDWCAKMSRNYLKIGMNGVPFIFVLFILIANFFFLNVLIAIASQNFQSWTDWGCVGNFFVKSIKIVQKNDNKHKILPKDIEHLQLTNFISKDNLFLQAVT